MLYIKPHSCIVILNSVMVTPSKAFYINRILTILPRLYIHDNEMVIQWDGYNIVMCKRNLPNTVV